MPPQGIPPHLAELGRYRLVEKLGQGGMASVYRAEDVELGRAVAIKVMHQFLDDQEEGQARFVREARAVAALRHPHVLTLHDYVPAEGERPACLVMELIRGPTLRRFIGEHGTPPAEVVAMIGCKLAAALQAAHQTGVVHRDLKPENVMVDQGGRLVLCDFGVARLVEQGGTVTSTGHIVGSPAYMSPEQASGEAVDHRSDLFSLGTVLYELATGCLPFTAKPALVLLLQVRAGRHKPPSVHNPRIPRYLERVIERCLQVDRPARWPDAVALGEALTAGLRSDGLGDIDRELGAYFTDPRGFCQALEARMVDVSLRRAEEAVHLGEFAQALGLCNRVLAWREEEPTALGLVRRIERRGQVRRGLMVAGALLGALALSTGGWFAYTHRAAPQAVGTSSPRPVQVKAAEEAVPASRGAVGLPAGAAQVPARAREGAASGAPSPSVAPAASPGVPDGTAEPHGGTIAARAKGARTPSGPVPRPVVPGSETPAGRPPERTVQVQEVAAVVASPGAPAPDMPARAAGGPTGPIASTTTTDGELVLRARPWCNGTVDGRLAISDVRPTLRLPPGTHRVRCQGPQGVVEERVVNLAAGERSEVSFDFRQTTVVELHLSRGDQVAFGNDPPRAGPQRQTTGVAREVRLYRQGQEVDHGYVDILPGCVLVDAPRLECRK